MATAIRNRLFGIDTEYHTDGLGRIARVYCLCATSVSGKVYKRWYEGKCPNALEEIKSYYEVEDPIFVCHSFEKAERRALKWLGVDTFNYSFICTWHLAKMLKKTFKKPKKEVFDTDVERIAQEKQNKEKEEKELSYASLCKKYGLALINTEHKDAMHKLCIEDKTEGYEQELLAYCAEDTEFLIPLLRCLFSEYYKALKGSFCPLRPGFFNEVTPEGALMRLVRQTEYINCFGDFADYGVPVNMERVKAVREHAIAYSKKLKSDFAEKYPGVLYQKKDGSWHEYKAKTFEYLEADLKKRGITSYPLTDTGKLSLSSDTLKDYFKGSDAFGEHYRKMNEITRKLTTIAKTDDNPFNYIIDGRLWYESMQLYGTKTSRCTPSTTRYMFGWAKMLYCIIDPPPKKWLVELDFTSQETFVQCSICKDAVYNEIYNSKDIYLGFATKMKLIPEADWETLSVTELKEKYYDVRKRVKSLVLGLSYGMGKAKLAGSLGISETEAGRYVQQFRQVIHASTSYKELLTTRLGRCNAFSLPDGFICSSATNRQHNSATTIGNWPFQSSGGMILRVVVRELYRLIRSGELNIRLIATVHDAVVFMCDEGDTATVQRVSEIMREMANRTLATPQGWTIRVGEPEIITHGQLWTPEHAHDEQALELLNYSEAV